MEARSIATGFSFLWNKASFELGANLTGFRAGDSFADAFIAGVINTLSVSIISIIVATFIGVFIGVFRISSNPLARGLAASYIEVIRNIPLLLQMLFWYVLVTNALPHPRQSLAPLDGVFINNRGLYAPFPENSSLISGLLSFIIVWLSISIFLRRYIRQAKIVKR